MTNKRNNPHPPPFHSAEEEATGAKKHTPYGEAYELAFSDPDFLLREELRPIRLQLELLKPELIQRDANINSTIVIFGSARIPAPDVAEQQFQEAETIARKHPEDETLQEKLRVAKSLMKKSNFYNEARKLGALISEASQQQEDLDYVIVTGGGPGIMEAANRGAHDVNAKNIGLNIYLPMEQGPNPYVTPELSFQFHYFAVRKMHFLIRARALIAFPGGFGTLDELFEALTLMQTKKIDPMPILLFGKEFWTRIINFDQLVEEGMVCRDDLKLFRFADTAEEAWVHITKFYESQTERRPLNL